MNFAELLGDSAKPVFERATSEVRDRGQGELEPEHFLYALLTVDTVRTGKILTHIGVKPSTLQLRVDAILARMKSKHAASASSEGPSLSRRSLNLLSSAFHEMVKDGKKAIESEHLLLALATSERFGRLGKLLKEFDVTYDSLELCIKDSGYIDPDEQLGDDKAQSLMPTLQSDNRASEAELKKLIELLCDSALALVLTSGLKNMLSKAPSLITAEHVFEAVLRTALHSDATVTKLMNELLENPTRTGPQARQFVLDYSHRRREQYLLAKSSDEEYERLLAELELMEKTPGITGLSKEIRLAQPVERFLIECAYMASRKGRNKITCADIVTVFMTRETPDGLPPV